MNKTRIVEYSREYAASVADMWNKSSSNWGGSDTFYTGEEIAREHENNDHIYTFLALDNDIVIGYCSFNEYKEDEGALYIPLLNVRPDYHGKKVGKKLVMTAVEKAIELSWPRLDLYTWPGNTKAVPLYKKCGFFWEKRDDSTHLMNFLPTVLNTEAVKDYFRDINWYKDSVREIEIKPDGSQEDDFNIYQYKWETDTHSLKMEFDRRGRGIRLIETDDYLIKSILPDYQLPFENNYKIKYYIKNKSGKSLSISINGLDNKNIKFKMEETVNVVDEISLLGEFYLNTIEEEQNIFRTHPSVTAEIYINGKKAVFRSGVLPKFPAKVRLIIPEGEVITDIENTCYLDIENGYNKPVKYSFNIPENKDIEFLDSDFLIEMKAREKKSIPVKYILRKFNFYSSDIDISISSGKEKTDYQLQVSASFNGRGSKYGGERDKDWIICNGTYQMSLSKSDNQIKLRNYNTKEDRLFLLFPRIGLPYTTEFSKKRAEDVEFIEEDQSMLMKVYYIPQKCKLEIISYLRLYSDGLLENYYEVHNNGELETVDEILIARGVLFSLLNAIMPYDGEIIELKSSENIEWESWDLNLLSENWLFNSCEGTRNGICWPPSANLKLNDWHFLLEENLGKIPAESKKSTEAIYLTIDTYDNLYNFRSFALKKYGINGDTRRSNSLSGLEPVSVPKDTIDVLINDGNPFIVGDFKVGVKRYKKANLIGDISINSMKNNFKKISTTFVEEDSLREKEIDIPHNDSTNRNNIDLLNININLESFSLKKKRPVFFFNQLKKIKRGVLSEEGKDVYSVQNGDIEYRASVGYAPSLYSLTYKGFQLLDSAYPEVGPRSWWNPWSGGILTHPGNLKNVTIHEAERGIEFVELLDNMGNKWQGISIEMKYNDHEKYKNLLVKQYYLSLPDLPLLLLTNQIVQGADRYINKTKFVTEIFLNPADQLNKAWLKHYKSNGEEIKYKAGINGYDIFSYNSFIIANEDRKDIIQIYQSGADPLWGVLNMEVLGVFVSNKISLPAGSSLFTPPTILIINDSEIEAELLSELRNIRFR